MATFILLVLTLSTLCHHFAQTATIPNQFTDVSQDRNVEEPEVTTRLPDIKVMSVLGLRIEDDSDEDITSYGETPEPATYTSRKVPDALSSTEDSVYTTPYTEETETKLFDDIKDEDTEITKEFLNKFIEVVSTEDPETESQTTEDIMTGTEEPENSFTTEKESSEVPSTVFMDTTVVSEQPSSTTTERSIPSSSNPTTTTTDKTTTFASSTVPIKTSGTSSFYQIKLKEYQKTSPQVIQTGQSTPSTQYTILPSSSTGEVPLTVPAVVQNLQHRFGQTIRPDDVEALSQITRVPAQDNMDAIAALVSAGEHGVPEEATSKNLSPQSIAVSPEVYSAFTNTFDEITRFVSQGVYNFKNLLECTVGLERFVGGRKKRQAQSKRGMAVRITRDTTNIIINLPGEGEEHKQIGMAIPMSFLEQPSTKPKCTYTKTQLKDVFVSDIQIGLMRSVSLLLDIEKYSKDQSFEAKPKVLNVNGDLNLGDSKILLARGTDLLMQLDPKTRKIILKPGLLTIKLGNNPSTSSLRIHSRTSTRNIWTIAKQTQEAVDLLQERNDHLQPNLINVLIGKSGALNEAEITPGEISPTDITSIVNAVVSSIATSPIASTFATDTSVPTATTQAFTTSTQASTTTPQTTTTTTQASTTTPQTTTTTTQASTTTPQTTTTTTQASTTTPQTTTTTQASTTTPQTTTTTTQASTTTPQATTTQAKTEYQETVKEYTEAFQDLIKSSTTSPGPSSESYTQTTSKAPSQFLHHMKTQQTTLGTTQTHGPSTYMIQPAMTSHGSNTMVNAVVPQETSVVPNLYDQLNAERQSYMNRIQQIINTHQANNFQSFPGTAAEKQALINEMKKINQQNNNLGSQYPQAGTVAAHNSEQVLEMDLFAPQSFVKVPQPTQKTNPTQTTKSVPTTQSITGHSTHTPSTTLAQSAQIAQQSHGNNAAQNAQIAQQVHSNIVVQNAQIAQQLANNNAAQTAQISQQSAVPNQAQTAQIDQQQIGSVNNGQVNIKPAIGSHNSRPNVAQSNNQFPQIAGNPLVRPVGAINQNIGQHTGQQIVRVRLTPLQVALGMIRNVFQRPTLGR